MTSLLATTKTVITIQQVNTLHNMHYLHFPARVTVPIHTIFANSLSTDFTAFFSCRFVVEAAVAGPITLPIDPVAVIAT